MADNPFVPVLKSIRRMVGLDDAAQSADALLLERFARMGDESAFAALVKRHGALVWGVCRRVTGNAHAAEDAFQATWIVLMRKAGSLRDGPLPGWLHRVAFRLSLAGRPKQAAPLKDAPSTEVSPEDKAALRETRAVIDQEVNRLPAKYRLPVVLCFLEGRTHAEAAAEMGCPVGTVAGRMARAKTLLHARLTRRGLASLTLPVPLVGAMPAVATSKEATALAGALLAAEARRPWLVGAAILLLAAVGVAAGVAFFASGTKPEPPPLKTDEPRQAWIPRDRIGPVRGAFALSPAGSLLAASVDGPIRLFDAQTSKAVATLDGGVDWEPHILLFSPDGAWIAAARKGQPMGEIKVWNLATRRGHSLEWGAGLGGSPTGVMFSPDGSTLLADMGSDDKDQPRKTHAWDVASGKRLRSFRGVHAALSPDGNTLATCDRDDNRTWLCELSSGKELLTLPGLYPRFHPDGEIVATVGYDAFVRLWERQTGKPRGLLDLYEAEFDRPRPNFSPEDLKWCHKVYSRIGEDEGDRGDEHLAFGRVNPLPVLPRPRPPVFSPDGTILACTLGRNRAQLWSISDSKVLSSLEGHPCAFSPDGKLLHTRWLGADGQHNLWDIATGKRVWGPLIPCRRVGDFLCDRQTSPERQVCGGPDGKLSLAGGLHASRVWGGPIPYERVGDILFAPDGKLYLAAGFSDGVLIRRWDLRTGREQGALPANDSVAFSAVAFSPDGTLLLTANPAKVWDARTGREVCACLASQEEKPGGYPLGFSSDCTRALTVAGPAENSRSLGTVTVWDARTGKELLSFEGPTYETLPSPDGTRVALVVLPALSPDGTHVALVEDNCVCIRDATTGAEVRRLLVAVANAPMGMGLPGGGPSVRGVAFSSDGTRLFTWTHGDATVYDTATWRKLRSHQWSAPMRFVAFSPDGTQILTYPEFNGPPALGLPRPPEEFRPKVRDAETGKDLYPLDSLPGASRAVWSPDGKYLALAGRDPGLIVLYDAKTGRSCRSLPGGNGRPVFSPDGKTLATGTLLWDVSCPE